MTEKSKQISSLFYSGRTISYIFMAASPLVTFMIALRGIIKGESADLFSAALLAIMSASLFFHAKPLYKNMVDFVYDCGDHLLVKKGKEEQKIFFSDIKNVSHESHRFSYRISLLLRNNSKFGNQIVFWPKPSSIWRIRNLVAENLIERVDQARGMEKQ